MCLPIIELETSAEASRSVMEELKSGTDTEVILSLIRIIDEDGIDNPNLYNIAKLFSEQALEVKALDMAESVLMVAAIIARSIRLQKEKNLERDSKEMESFYKSLRSELLFRSPAESDYSNDVHDLPVEKQLELFKDVIKNA